MVKTYYCDYCNRSFKDITGSRKRHLQGIQHKNNRDKHYARFRDPKVVVQEESTKKPCQHMLTTGDCIFGLSCRYSHYTPEMIAELQNMIFQKEQLENSNKYRPDPKKMAKEFFQNVLNDEEETVIDDQFESYPQYLNGQNVPISMWPIDPTQFKDCLLPEWGDR